MHPRNEQTYVVHQHRPTTIRATTSNFNCIIMCSLQFIILHYYLWVFMLLSCVRPLCIVRSFVCRYLLSLMLLVLFYLFSLKYIHFLCFILSLYEKMKMKTKMRQMHVPVSVRPFPIFCNAKKRRKNVDFVPLILYTRM